jgi:hypothetical protein
LGIGQVLPNRGNEGVGIFQAEDEMLQGNGGCGFGSCSAGCARGGTGQGLDRLPEVDAYESFVCSDRADDIPAELLDGRAHADWQEDGRSGIWQLDGGGYLTVDGGEVKERTEVDSYILLIEDDLGSSLLDAWRRRRGIIVDPNGEVHSVTSSFQESGASFPL